MAQSSIKTAGEIEAMREGGKMLSLVLAKLKDATEPGRCPKDMSAIARKELKALGGEPAFLGYEGYPDVLCVSVNNQVQHSIPTAISFKRGDVVNYDFGVRYKGLVTDAGITVCVDDAFTKNTKRLIEGTEKALYAGLHAVKAGSKVGDISAAIERVLRTYKLGIVQELVGHGVGHSLHEEPEIPNYGKAGRGPLLTAGMTIAVEPITTLGHPAIYQTRDGWTLVTQDGSWSAQFEHTVLVTTTGCEILTVV